MRKILLIIFVFSIAGQSLYASELDIINEYTKILEEQGYNDIEISGILKQHMPELNKMVLDSNNYTIYEIEEQNPIMKQINPNIEPDRKCGYKDRRGKIVISAEKNNFHKCGFFKNGFATVELLENKVNSKTGVSYKYMCIISSGDIYDEGACHGFTGYFGNTENWAINLGIVE